MMENEQSWIPSRLRYLVRRFGSFFCVIGLAGLVGLTFTGCTTTHSSNSSISNTSSSLPACFGLHLQYRTDLAQFGMVVVSAAIPFAGSNPIFWRSVGQPIVHREIQNVDDTRAMPAALWQCRRSGNQFHEKL